MKYLAILLGCSVLLSGCFNDKSISNFKTEPNIVQSIIEETIPVATGEIDNPSDSTNTPQEIVPTYEIKPEFTALIYSGNDNADGFIVTECQIEELNTDTLIAKLIELNALGEGTEVLSEKLEGTCLHLDLNSEFANQVCSTGTSGERMIIGSLVNTFIENYRDTVQTIRITVDGDILESGHVIYDFELAFFE